MNPPCQNSIQQPTVIFFRHSPVRNKGICYGQSFQETTHTPIEVSDRFVNAYTDWLTLHHVDFTHEQIKLWSSPAHRCLAPAQVIAERLDSTLNCDPKLYEMSFGQWESKTWEQIEKEDYDAFHKWMKDWQVESPPDGESLYTFHQRVRAWYSQLHDQSLNIVIGHAGVWRSLLVHRQCQTWDDAMSVSVPHLQLIEL